MAGKDIKKMNRLELLEVLMQQAARIEQLERQVEQMEQLQQELDSARRQLEQIELKQKQCGSIAEAAIAVSGVFEAAQRAADLYLEYLYRRGISG